MYFTKKISPLPGGQGGRKFLHMEFLKDLWHFLKERKKWWLMPLIILFVLVTVLIVLGSTTALAPFIYSLF